ncbi:Tetracycline resistance protein TetB/drug resistance transporter [Lasiodiplodia theobromae]|uniref:Tetracycline resistance protein TetB/drug resistance transporter n=1 Tax=Lasiodiplodia theobromae TaxID=45133 RepID=UPI0015C3E1CD|nr:Tetracycline resistance protein TetB/drug resistance transporter [Lasiodiplodia theobromae]KAF4536950.1 Tetracycline resistance protein TetB/drug resistance transporter [Lasiodiplodia theobromae]
MTATGDQSDVEKAPVFNEQTKYLPRRRIIAVFLACASIDFAALLDQTSLAASLSIIGRSLDASNQTSWISGAYFVTSTSFQLLYGRLSDIWSRKIILLIGIAIFFIGSLASSLAQDVVQLIVFRAFTGVGGGGLMTVAQFIVSDVVPLRERGKYQGILGAFVGLGNGVGPVIGGALASQSEESWRWIFRLNLPLSVIMVVCVVFFMPLKKVEGDWKVKLKAIDFTGAVLALGGSAVLVLALTWAGGEYPWHSAHVIASFVVGFFVCILFVLWQWKGTSVPLVPLHIFRSRVVNGATITMFINGWNFVTQVYYIPTFYQLVYRYSSTKSGALLLPITLTQTLSSTLSGLLVTWTGRYREAILFGWALWAVGLGLFSTLDEGSGLGKQVGFAVLTGWGVGSTLQPSLVAIQAGVARRDMAIVTSWRNFIRNLGATLGLAVAGTIVNNSLRGAVAPLGLSSAEVRSLLKNPENVLSQKSDAGADAERIRTALMGAYKDGFRILFYVNAALAAVAFFVALALLPQISLVRDDDKKLQEEARAKEEARRNGKDEAKSEAKEKAGP